MTLGYKLAMLQSKLLEQVSLYYLSLHIPEDRTVVYTNPDSRIFHTQIPSDLLFSFLQPRFTLDLHLHPRQILQNNLPEDTADLLKTLPPDFPEQGDSNSAHNVFADEQRVVLVADIC